MIHRLNPQLRFIALLVLSLIICSMLATTTACGGHDDDDDDEDNRQPAGIHGTRGRLCLSQQSLPTAPIFNHFQDFPMGFSL